LSEAHVAYTGIGSVEDVMYAIFQFMDNSGTGRSASGVQWADNDITHAVHNGSSFAANSAAVTGASYFNGTSYMVIESATAMPSGNRWSCKIHKTGNDLKYDFGPRDGWDYGRQDFGVSGVSSGLILWNDENDPTTGTTVMISASNMDTYGASATVVEYFRCMIREVTLNDGSQFQVGSIRVGGYIPTDAVNDTNPACVLAGLPTVDSDNEGWGKVSTAIGYQMSVCPPDTDGSETDLGAGRAACYIASTGTSNQAPGNDSNNLSRTRAGQWVNFPVFLISIPAADTVGYYGKYDMFGVGGSFRADGDAYANNEYINGNTLLFRWKP